MPVHAVRRPSGQPQGLALAQSPPAAHKKIKEKTMPVGIKLMRSQVLYRAAQARKNIKEKTTPFGTKLMRSQVLYRAAQVQHATSSK